MEYKKLSIIIPCYFKASVLRHGLASIQKQNVSVPYEIVVLNDGVEEDDETLAVCKKFPLLPIKYLFTGQRNTPTSIWRCPGFAINIGVKQCLGELIIIQQPEIYYITENTINTMIEEVEHSPKRIIAPVGMSDTGGHLKMLDAEFAFSKVTDSCDVLDYKLPFCMIMHRSTFENIGGYDEDLTGYCFDDNDLVDRLKGHGCSFGFMPSFEIIHLYHSRLHKDRIGLVNRDKDWHYNRNIYMGRKGKVVRNTGREWGVFNAPDAKFKDIQADPSKISIVMPTYNQSRFIMAAIDSILAQTHTNWELIIVDDGSTDNTTEILAKITDPRIRVVRKKNGGTGLALNYGFKHATGDYETWFASDNIMYPDNLRTLLAEITDCDYVYSNCYQVMTDDETGMEEVEKRLFSTLVPTMTYSYAELRRGYNLGICWLWRKDLRLKCTEIEKDPGLFQKEPCEDYDMALRMAEVGGRFKYIPQVLGWQRQHKWNLTTTVVDKKGNPNAKTHFVHQKASRRTATKSMKIAIINLEFDCAGVGWNLKQAIEKYTPHKCKHVTGKLYPYASKTDLLLDLRGPGRTQSIRDLREVMEWADVLHFNQWIWNHNPAQHQSPFDWNPYKDTPITEFAPYFKRKRVMFHFHSGELLSAPEYYMAEAEKAGATILTCDPPSELCVPGARWIPNVLDFSGIPQAPEVSNNKGIKVYSGHGINDDRKNGALYKRYIETMEKAGYNVSFEAMNGIEKTEAFIKRCGFQIAMESLTEGYIGMVGWEAMAMGQVVLARLAPSTLKCYASLGAPPPIKNCDTAALMMQEIRELHNDRDRLRKEMEASRQWMQTYYQPRKIVDMYIKAYEGSGL